MVGEDLPFDSDEAASLLESKLVFPPMPAEVVFWLFQRLWRSSGWVNGD